MPIPKKLEIQKNVKSVKELKIKIKNPKQCHEIEPNPSKDRATCMYEGDNTSF
jgi:hypothetical protein